MFDERIALGLPSLADYGLFEAISIAKKLGFQSVMAFPGGPKARHSLGTFATLNFYEADEDERKRLRDSLCEFKHVSIHQSWDTKWQRWIDCASYFRAEIITVHAGKRTQGESMEQFLGRQLPFLSKIGDYAQSKGIKVGLENEGGRCFEYESLINTIKHPAVGATIDVGHCSYFEEVKSIADLDERVKQINKIIHQLLRRLRTKVYHLHVHNVQRYDAIDFSNIPHPYWEPGSLVDHRCIAEGEIDFVQLFVVLREIGYCGLFDIELEEPQREEKAFKSAEYLTKLLQSSSY